MIKRSTLGWTLGICGALSMSLLAPRDVPAADDEFQPTIEADLPAGFPGPGPVGEVVVKQYPAYRLARTAMTERGNGSFWTLFRHIKEKRIEMTAPVEMTLDQQSDGVLAMRSMAFLYGSAEMGKAGRDGDVEVIDVEATTVASIGVRGARGEKSLAASLASLEAWLTANASTWRRVGEPRVLSYNSPMVPVDRRFHELQVRLEKVTGESKSAPPPDSRKAW